jgi:hypothetical protein
MPVAAQDFLRLRATRGLVLAFFAITAFMWLGVIAAAKLGNVTIGKDGSEDQILREGSYVKSVKMRLRRRFRKNVGEESA